MNKKRTRILCLSLIGCLLLICCFTASSLAVLSSSTEPVVNVLTKSTEPGIEIEEDLTNGKKVAIRNTGTESVYVEVYLSVCYRNGTTNEILPADFSYVKGDARWIWNGNSAKWPNPLAPDAETGLLISNVTAPEAPEGYHLEVKVIAQNVRENNK